VAVRVTTTLLLAALAFGYAIGRLRPWDRLDTWVWRRVTFGGTWTRSKPQQILTIAAHIVVRPLVSLDIWRHRHDPPPRKSPPVRVRRLYEDGQS
jgi:hypothetical protein